jgi:formyl-CoA transferase
MFKVSDGHLITGAGNDAQFRKLCQQIGAPQLIDDPRFASNSDRLTNAAALRAEIEAALAPQRAVEMALKLMRAGVPAGAVQDTAQAMNHPHTLHRQMNVEIPGYRGTGVPVKLSRTPGSVRSRPPKFGEHTDRVLAEAGLSAEQIAQLRTAGVIVDEPKAV